MVIPVGIVSIQVFSIPSQAPNLRGPQSTAMDGGGVSMLVAFHHCDKLPKKINLTEERFILAEGSKGFSPWSAGSVLWA